jgi:transposase InsO family protein
LVYGYSAFSTWRTIKGVGRIYQQTFIDTYSKVAFAKLYDRKNALVAADMLNDQVIPFFEEQDVPMLRILTDRGTEYCGSPEHHEYELYLGIEEIEHTRTKARSPQTNGICERFHKTMLQEFYQVAFRKKETKRTCTSVYAIVTEFSTECRGYRLSNCGRWRHCLLNNSKSIKR